MAKEPTKESATIKVRLNTGMVGNVLSQDANAKDRRVLSQFSHQRGDEVEMKADEARKYIAAGYASPVTE